MAKSMVGPRKDSLRCIPVAQSIASLESWENAELFLILRLLAESHVVIAEFR